MSIPADLSYTSEHEWLRREGETAVVGITAYAADALGDVVYVDLPEVGAQITAGEACGELESTKSVSDLFAPADGEVVKVNDKLGDDAGLVNSDPYGEGWLFVVKVSGEPDTLDAAGYAELIGE
ncbi:glycine cleavage system protein GcvH [Nocardioides insulae]|uniref:glycine cleavage system protein GcvH n=1 Tax=Nocardioides insulae TaxID=394734 RepID=UPI00040462AE|nr:glycine cleavage system protein GcvH [Nocardioides insulae]